MKNDRSFMKCLHCGNIIGMIEDSGVVPVCCGEEMTLLKPNTVDASAEKHVPVATRKGNTISINVGSADHPMTPEHYIPWITLAQKNHTQRIALTPDDKPHAEFCADEGPATVYAYCNLHGLWSSEV